MKQGDVVEWLVSGPPGEYDLAVVVDHNDAGFLIIFQVYGSGPFHLSTVPEGPTSAGLRKVRPLARELDRWEVDRYHHLLQIADTFKQVQK